MRYFIAKGPLIRFGYEWIYSYYKAYPDRRAEATRFYSDGSVVNNTIERLNPEFVMSYCQEITEEEYKSIQNIWRIKAW